MHSRALRTVLLIQAIEETDRVGEVIPLADRADATRTIARIITPAAAEAGAPLSRQSQDFLLRRAELLLERLRARAPAVAQVLALAAGLTWVTRALLIVAFMFGVSLAALDGSRRINIIAFPLLGLIAWNLFIYVLLLGGWIRGRMRRAGSGRWSTAVYERWIGARMETLLRHATRFNVPLTTALRHFMREWNLIARPLLMLRVKCLLHIAAVCVALGLIAGLYFRGLVLRYEAGWESTFLGPASAHALLEVLYGPAAAVAGIALGSTDEIRALRWTATGGGGEAAVWIHLIALTAVLYIVLPRGLAALVASFGAWRFSRRPPVPPGLLGYARALFISAGGGTVSEVAGVIPYAYEPSERSQSGLQSLLGAALGGNIKMTLRNPVRYGDEDAIDSAGAADSWNVLLLTLASTPEAENHGRLITRLRDRLSGGGSGNTPLLIVVDEGPFTSRLRGEPVFEKRLAERRTLWHDFIAGYGLRACVVDLLELRPGNAVEIEARESARAALWTAAAQ